MNYFFEELYYKFEKDTRFNVLDGKLLEERRKVYINREELECNILDIKFLIKGKEWFRETMSFTLFYIEELEKVVVRDNNTLEVLKIKDLDYKLISNFILKEINSNFSKNYGKMAL